MNAFRIVAIVVSLLAWSVWLVAALHTRGIHPIREVLSRWSRLGVFGKIAIALFFAHLAIYGSTKPSGTNSVDQVSGTNDVEIVEGGNTNEIGEAASPPLLMVGARPFTNGETPLPLTVPCYRLESISTNEGYSYAMPTDASVRGTWHIRGAYEDVMKVGLGDFRFPLGSDLCSLLWIHTWGKVRPQLHNAANEIAASGMSMSAVPGESRFWTVATTNGTYLLTWENFFLERDTNMPANAQIELSSSGDFVTRFNDLEATYSRVIPPNPITPVNPPDPVFPLRSLHPFGAVQDLSVIEETNAYCWVDIVVDRADAWVNFRGDGISNLSDPSFAAKAGETNHVIILIGKTYEVTCDMPFRVIAKSDTAIEEWWQDDHTLWLNWPVDIWAQGDGDMPLLLLGAGNGSRESNGFTMHVWPSSLGGAFNWTNCCCSISGGGNHFSYNCNGDCACGGCCATGYYGYEGYRLPAWGGSCGCGSSEEPHDPHEDPDEPADPVGVSVSFSKKVIFLENEYANTTNEVVPWYSDTESLSCAIWGGPNGGHVSISISGDSNLIQYGGRQLPFERDIAPYEVLAFTNTYKAVSESGGYEDILVSAAFIENDTGWSETSIARATAVRVEVGPQVFAPENECEGRHKFGVGEVVEYRCFPAISLAEWIKSGDGDLVGGIGRAEYSCAMHAECDGVRISCQGEDYTPAMTVVEPSGVCARNVGYRSLGLGSGHAGGILLTMTLHALPLDVSFSRILIEEVPYGESRHSGYFDDAVFIGEWYHGSAQHAGIWSTVFGDNQFLSDEAGFRGELPQVDGQGEVSLQGTCGWANGELAWQVLCGWGSPGSMTDDDPVGTFATDAWQIMTIDADGDCEVRKHGNSVSRMIGGRILLNGEVMQ